jgi:hypothetical protein
LGSGWPTFGIVGVVGLWVGRFGTQAVSPVPVALIFRVLGFFAVVVMLRVFAAFSISVYWSFAGGLAAQAVSGVTLTLVSTGIRVALIGCGIFGWSPLAAFPAGAGCFGVALLHKLSLALR